MLKRLGKQCKINCKLRNCVPWQLLIFYYKSNIKPIIQDGISLYAKNILVWKNLSTENFEVHSFS